MTSKDELTANAGWPQWATVGAKVVLIDGTGGIQPSDKTHLEGKVFIIIETTDVFTEPAVRVRNAETGDDNDPWTFGKLSRYRPLHTIESDVNMVKESLLSIGNEELAADKQRVDELLMSLEAAWAAYPGEGE